VLIGAISDTHDNVEAIGRACEVFRREGVELVIHAGDWVAPFALAALRRCLGAEVRIVGVFGNNEGERPLLLRRASEHNVEILGEAGLVEVDGRKIGIYHGTTPILIEAMVRSNMFDIVITGHTHKPEVRRGTTLLVNPGEACGCLYGRRSLALIDPRTLSVELREF